MIKISLSKTLRNPFKIKKDEKLIKEATLNG